MASIDPYIYTIIGLIGVAYPLLLQVMAQLYQKYSFNSIVEVFNKESESKAIKVFLVISLLSIVIWSLRNWLKIPYYLPDILVGISAVLLVISFFFYMKKILIYNVHSKLIDHLKDKRKSTKDPLLDYFSVLSDLLIWSIRKKNIEDSKTLVDYFYDEFKAIREKSNNKPVVYPEKYYELVYKAIEELSVIKEKRNIFLEHITSCEIWLLGEFEESEISEETYNWMWRNLLLAITYERDDFIMNHWKNCHQHFEYCLTRINEEYDGTSGKIQITNKEIVEKREKERHRFKEFHYALGGLLTYKKRYGCLKQIFDYTQDLPPKYVLLPESMDEIFNFYNDIRDPFEDRHTWISAKYPFPETSGIKADRVTKHWIMSYMAILFLRQYTIHPHLITMKPLDFPEIPSKQIEISQWIEGLDLFKKLVGEHLENRDLLKTLNLSFITKEWCDREGRLYPTEFIEEFRKKLEEKHNENALKLQISDEKVRKFENSTKEIIEETFEKLKPINNLTPIEDGNSDKWHIYGQRTLVRKDALSPDPEVELFGFDSFLASAVSSNIVSDLGETFRMKTSQSYLLKPEDIFKGIDKLKIDENYIIVTFDLYLEYFISQLKVPDLSKTKYRNIDIHSFSVPQIERESLFVLKKSDLPAISAKPIDEKIIEKYSLKRISEKINLYSSVIDMNNASDELFNEHKNNKTDDELRKSVLLSLFISLEIKWKKNINVIKLRQYSDYEERGIVNTLDEVKQISD